MADDDRREANERLKSLALCLLDDVVVEAALNPGLSGHSQAAEVEIRRRLPIGRKWRNSPARSRDEPS